MWWGPFFTACAWWPGAATVLASIAMTCFLVAKTGKPLMASYLRSTRPGYAEYVDRTSGFVPIPPRRSSRSRY